MNEFLNANFSGKKRRMCRTRFPSKRAGSSSYPKIPEEQPLNLIKDLPNRTIFPHGDDVSPQCGALLSPSCILSSPLSNLSMTDTSMTTDSVCSSSSSVRMTESFAGSFSDQGGRPSVITSVTNAKLANLSVPQSSSGDDIRQIKRKLECPDCGKEFSQLRNYRYHRSRHEGTSQFACTCPVCGKSFNDKGYLSSHLKIHKNAKEYKCEWCDKSFNQRVAYNMHIRIHTGLKPHQCDICPKAFSRKMLLRYVLG